MQRIALGAMAMFVGPGCWMHADAGDPQNNAILGVSDGGITDGLSLASLNTDLVDRAPGLPEETALPGDEGGAPPNGLRGNYYDGASFEELRVVRLDPIIDFKWGDGSPDPAVPVNAFSVRWTGKIQPAYSELYTFHATTDDGVRLWIDGRLVIDWWIDQVVTERIGAIQLVAEQSYDFKMEYYERTEGALASLAWSSPSQELEIVPTTRLHAR